EVAWAADNPLSEVIVPDAVRHHPRGERIRGVCQPVGESRAPAAGVQSFRSDNLRRSGIENRQEAWLNLIQRRIPHTLREYVSGRRLSSLVHHDFGHGRLLRLNRIELSELFLERRIPIPGLPLERLLERRILRQAAGTAVVPLPLHGI